MTSKFRKRGARPKKWWAGYVTQSRVDDRACWNDIDVSGSEEAATDAMSKKREEEPTHLYRVIKRQLVRNEFKRWQKGALLKW